MKRILLILTGILCYLFTSANNVVITGTISPKQDGCVMRAYLDEGSIMEQAAMDTVRNGKFRIEFDLTQPDTRFIYLSCLEYGSRQLRYFPVKPGAEVNVDITSPNIFQWEITSNIPEQAQYGAFADGVKDLKVAYDDLDARLEAVDSDSTLTYDEKRNLWNRIKQAMDSVDNQVILKQTELFKQLPVSEMWMQVFNDAVRFLDSVPDSVVLDLKNTYEALPAQWKESKSGQQIKAYLYPPEVVGEGDMMADADFYDLDGNIRHLAEFNGKWRLLDFWSAGCYPCIVATAELQMTADQYKDSLEVVSISRDPEKQWRAASQRHNITWTNWNDLKEETGIHMKYGINALPTFILVSPDGKIVEKWDGYSFGALRKHIRSRLKLQPEPAVNQSGDTVTVHNPVVEQNTTDGIIELEKVVITPDAVTLHFLAFQHPQYWIKIVPESYIMTPDGTRYTTTGADGIELGAEYYTGKDWTGRFSLTFPPLPHDTATFDFVESPDWQLNAIHLP